MARTLPRRIQGQHVSTAGRCGSYDRPLPVRREIGQDREMGTPGDITDLARPQPRSHLLDAAMQLITPLLQEPDRRVLVGITGPPAAGKSTLSIALAATYERQLGEHRAVAVPM